MTATKKKEKLKEFVFSMFNRRSDTAFKATVKGKNYEDALAKVKIKFPYPVYDFE